MLKLWDSAVSGNAYKVRLLLAQIGLEYERIETDVLDRSNRPKPLLEQNVNHRIPLLELGDGRSIAESNAILCYLADGTPFYADDAYGRAQIHRWLFFEQNHHEPNIAVARFLVTIARQAERYAEVIERLHKGGYAALDAMERHLTGGHDWFGADRYTIGDIALYAYTHDADEGGFDLAGYPGIRAWLDRVAGEPGHIPMR